MTMSVEAAAQALRPRGSGFTLTLLLIVFFMVEGFAKLLFSLTIRPLPNWAGSSQAALLEYCCLSIFWPTSPRQQSVCSVCCSGSSLSLKGWLSARWRGRCVGARKKINSREGLGLGAISATFASDAHR
jgi:hypothetical protein